MIEKVMKAEEYNPSKSKFPYLATPKIDGIRFFVHGGHLWSASNKPIPNFHIQQALCNLLPDGIDGELFAGVGFNNSTSLVMSDAKPLVDCGLVVHLFDLFTPEIGYHDRITNLNRFAQSLRTLGWRLTKKGWYKQGLDFRLKFLYPVWLTSAESVETYFNSCLALGHEGIILREPESKYHFGRHNSMLKYKPYIDREAEILGCEEMMVNTNEASTNELGRSKRSHSLDGMVPAGVLGSFHVRDVQTGVEFHVGNGVGLTHILRANLWATRHTLGGLIIKYRSLAYGQYEKPRQPQWIGFRDRRDM